MAPTALQSGGTEGYWSSHLCAQLRENPHSSILGHLEIQQQPAEGKG